MHILLLGGYFKDSSNDTWYHFAECDEITSNIGNYLFQIEFSIKLDFINNYNAATIKAFTKPKQVCPALAFAAGMLRGKRGAYLIGPTTPELIKSHG